MLTVIQRHRAQFRLPVRLQLHKLVPDKGLNICLKIFYFQELFLRCGFSFLTHSSSQLLPTVRSDLQERLCFMETGNCGIAFEWFNGSIEIKKRIYILQFISFWYNLMQSRVCIARSWNKLLNGWTYTLKVSLHAPSFDVNNILFLMCVCVIVLGRQKWKLILLNFASKKRIHSWNII